MKPVRLFTVVIATAAGMSLWAVLGAEPPSVALPGAAHSLRVLVDPRVELMSAIFRLAGNPEYNQARVKSYAEDANNQFGKFRGCEVVKLAQGLRRNRGVSFDAVMSMAVHLGDADQCQLKLPLQPWPEGLDQRWPAPEVSDFLAAAQRFAKDSSFPQFTQRHRQLYQTSVSRVQTLLKREAHLEWFDAYFGRRPQASFTVALGLLNGGGSYGPHLRAEDGREELYCVLGVGKTDPQGLPEFTREVVGTVVHEFCHSYANGIIVRHLPELRAAGETLYAPVVGQMRAQAYGTSQTMLYESLVRACTVRYVRRYEGEEAAQRAIQAQKARGFLWMQEMSDLLGQYEANRARYPTLEDFSPRLVAFFAESAKTYSKGRAGDRRRSAETPLRGS